MKVRVSDLSREGGHGHEVQPKLEHLFIDKWESESHKCQAEVMSQQTRALPPSNKVVVKIWVSLQER